MYRYRFPIYLFLVAVGLICAARNSFAQSEWVSASSGSWSDPNNWSSGVPDGSGQVAIFGALAGPNLNVSISGSPVTVGELQFLGPQAVTINGAQDLVLDVPGTGPPPSIIVDPNAPSSTIQNTLGGSQGLAKLGGGTLSLNGNLNYSGPTIIAEGILALGSSSTISNGPVIVDSGATWDVSSHTSYSLAAGQLLAGGGSVDATELRVTNDGFVDPGDGVGTLTLNGDLLLDSVLPSPAGRLHYELSSDPITPGFNDAIQVNGDIDIVGTHQVFVTPIDNQLSTGNYPLVSYTGTLNTGSGTLQVAHTTRLNLTIDTATPGSVLLNVSGNKANLTWNGNVNGDWDIGTTANWTGGGGLFFDLDCVTFDDTALTFNVNITQDVRPGEVAFNNNTQDYQISGPGAIRGNAPFIKNGAARVSIFNRTEFSTADLLAGTVEIGTGGEFVAFGDTTVANGANLELNGGDVFAPTLTVEAGGQLTGQGVIFGDVVVGTGFASGTPALFSPGFSPGTIEIQGNLDLESEAETVIEISGLPGNPHDIITVSGDALLDGTLTIDAIDGYVPMAGDIFEVLTSNDLSSTTFDDVQAARIGDIILWPTYTADTLFVIGQLVGDMNLSGIVDEDDIPQFAFALRDNVGYDNALYETEHEVADVDGNGRVDFGDIALFVDEVSQNSSLSANEVISAIEAVLAIPEPGSSCLSIIGAITLLLRRRCT